ncbi:NAD(P)/FAD-dependent oxidoreductase [Deinococcus deserti]|uniref:Putative FAD dependent oxidoreductase n=1 Tax=Deinococcus deserti (strain DSM 17065 / CIP 109153 / LMG 22923 / VCD115) TaxID=546414 RepID=C1D1V5_DEIDV|nr:FAD-binding oxidoreductase [Deinococcus deserti]ACO47394.1 putative FAD dependent oxidoreductase [Deinococcus deserti VCD115]
MHADVAIIGAGIIGAASAWRLAQRGLKVLVLEQGSPAGGSTGKSAAGVRAQFATPTNILLSHYSIQEYAELPQSGYHAGGYLLLIPDTQWAAHQKSVALQQQLGVPTQVLTPAQAQLHTVFDQAGLGGCTFCSTDGSVDAHGLTMTYVSQARGAGARFLLDTPVTHIRQQGELWLLSTPAGTVQARLVLNAAGAWAGEVGTKAGLNIPVQPARRMVFTTGPVKLPKPLPMVFDLDSGVWLRSEGERLIMGRADPSDVGWQEGMDWSWLEPTLEAAIQRFPWLETATLDRKASWWGYYEVTPDHQAIVGKMPGVDGWLNACGFSGHGVMHAAAIARVVAQEAVGETPFIDIDPLRYDRFAQGHRGMMDIQV